MTSTETVVWQTSGPTAALIDTLLADGWTYANPIRSERQWRSQIHELASPDGRLNVDASVYPDGHMIARLSAQSVGTGWDRTPGWMADLHEVPLHVALAALKAAADPERLPYSTPVAVTAALAGQGWARPADITERGRLLQREWQSPDGERAVRWHPADEHDEGGWSVDREGPGDGETQISQHTPAAVIAAFALTAESGEPDVDTAPSTAETTGRK